MIFFNYKYILEEKFKSKKEKKDKIIQNAKNKMIDIYIFILYILFIVYLSKFVLLSNIYLK